MDPIYDEKTDISPDDDGAQFVRFLAYSNGLTRVELVPPSSLMNDAAITRLGHALVAAREAARKSPVGV